VRVNGATNFNQQAYRTLMQSSSIETIKVMLGDWERQAKAKFGGGRQIDETVTDAEQEAKQPTKNLTSPIRLIRFAAINYSRLLTRALCSAFNEGEFSWLQVVNKLTTRTSAPINSPTKLTASL
jgi:hypothetical protein